MKTGISRIFLGASLFAVPFASAQGPVAAPMPGASQAIQLPLSGRAGQSGGVVVSQTPIAGVTSSVNTLNTTVQVQGPYIGSVPEKGGALPEGKLTLRDAIRRGLAYNLGPIGQEQARRQSLGQARVARSALLPSFTASLRDNLQQLNLAVFGFKFPGGPSVVGPFNYFDLRATLNQTIADFTTIHNYRAVKAGSEAAEFAARDARDLVVFAVAGAFLQVLTAQARIASVDAQIATAQALFEQLQQQKNVGLVAQIDVNRSQVESQMQQQRLVSLRNDLAKQKINLARLIGLRPDSALELAHDVPFTPAPELSIDQALKEARENRADLKAGEAQLRAAELALSAARAERLPSLAVSADYGVIGQNPANSHGTFTLVGSLRIPIWEGGRAEGHIQQAAAVVAQRRAEFDELRGRIEADLRASFLDLESARSQIEVASNSRELARQTLQLTRERLEAGITTTVEVVQAQQSISAAELDYVTSVFAYNVAKISVARGLGNTEETITRFLPVQ